MWQDVTIVNLFFKYMLGQWFIEFGGMSRREVCTCSGRSPKLLRKKVFSPPAKKGFDTDYLYTRASSRKFVRSLYAAWMFLKTFSRESIPHYVLLFLRIPVMLLCAPSIEYPILLAIFASARTRKDSAQAQFSERCRGAPRKPAAASPATASRPAASTAGSASTRSVAQMSRRSWPNENLTVTLS